MNKPNFIHKYQIVPEEYNPTEHLVLCGNEISRYLYLFSDNDFYPILIGAGSIPRIWLFAKGPKNEVITLVEDSVSNVDQFKIDIFNSSSKIEIKDIRSGTILLRMEFDRLFRVSEIDLRPVGYNIYGHENKLILGNANLSGNTFNNVNVIFSIGDKSQTTTSPNNT